MDVESSFCKGFLGEEAYNEQSIGYEVKGYKDKVLKLNFFLYGLKKTRAW